MKNPVNYKFTILKYTTFKLARGENSIVNFIGYEKIDMKLEFFFKCIANSSQATQKLSSTLNKHNKTNHCNKK